MMLPLHRGPHVRIGALLPSSTMALSPQRGPLSGSESLLIVAAPLLPLVPHAPPLLCTQHPLFVRLSIAR
eukprot:8391713-Pyramimonas_sp.AAC.1